MRRLRRPLLLATLAGTTLSLGMLTGGKAAAQQVDLNPPMPNVMILMDTSGSMEKMISGADPEDAAASTCSPGVQSQPNRWGIALQALTGDLQPYYSCAAMPRTAGSLFDNTYKILGVSAYDIGYHLPYHRPVSGSSAATACVMGPGKIPGAPAPDGIAGTTADSFPAASLTQKIYNVGTTCSYTQLSNGAIDATSDIIRFGLMTFDTDPAQGTGVTTPAPLYVSSNPFAGLWSYYARWDSAAASPFTGWPANCNTPALFEVGARNPAAPPWEGRMVRFPASNASLQDVLSNNSNIDKVLNATRPYGATPIAGMMHDARYYFWSDPTGPEQTDPYVNGSPACRDQYQILLTDGAPNLDLRNACEATGTPNGKCPYSKPEEIAADLLSGSGGRKVKTYVIGFAVSSYTDGTTPVNCSSLVTNGVLSSACTNPSDAAEACCTLQRIALAGGTTSAFFADTAGDLNKALGSIMGEIARNTTTRTVPAYSPVVANPSSDPNNPGTSSSLFLSSFVPTPGRPWAGTVQRQRLVCQYANGNYTVPPATVDATKGDDFAKNVNSHAGSTPRKFFAIQPDVQASPLTGVDSTRTIRPFVATTVGDQQGKYGGTAKGPAASDVITGVSYDALGIVANTSCANQAGNQWLSVSDCKALALNYVFGSQTTNAMPNATFAAFASRYDNAFGDIFHATPAVVGPPSALLRDESYQTFKTTYAGRKTLVYAATNDGLLRALDTSVSLQQNNEIWAFLPPAVMPRILSSYPANHQLLLDGSPIVKDVVFERSATTTDLLNGANWHTMLVASYGSQQRGYYAVDVSNPDPSALPTGGPQFRWQMTTMKPGEPNIFGTRSATPAITTVLINDNGTKKEVGVAILPGGQEGSASTTVGCDRVPTSKSAALDASPQTSPRYSTSAPSGNYAYRTKVRCWGATDNKNDPVVGRSVAVVRIDTGEILRVFMRVADAPSSLKDAVPTRIIATELDSPMTGTPILYPADTGAVAQKFFIGDADGTIWKFDVTNPDPSQWTGSLYLDTANTSVDTSNTSWGAGQPIQISPVIALDRSGNLALEIATGDTETYTATGTNYVYATTEEIYGTPKKLRAHVNWFLKLTSGERVSGPMAVFDGTFYFSTFAAASGGSVCSGGTAKLWGRDFMTPLDTADLSTGGLIRLQPPSGAQNSPAYVRPADYDSTLAGKIIPGVSVSVTPACASVTSASDNYVAGASHVSASNVTAGEYSLMVQVGGKNLNSGGQSNATYSQKLATPQTATVVDSWAAIVE